MDSPQTPRPFDDAEGLEPGVLFGRILSVVIDKLVDANLLTRPQVESGEPELIFDALDALVAAPAISEARTTQLETANKRLIALLRSAAPLVRLDERHRDGLYETICDVLEELGGE